MNMNGNLRHSLEKRRIERLLMGRGYSLAMAKAGVIQGWRFRWLARFPLTVPIFMLLVRSALRDVRALHVEKQKSPPTRCCAGDRQRPARRSPVTGKSKDRNH
jgi:hypothetical protein